MKKVKIFNTIQKAKIPKTAFNLSHEVKLTTDIGKLTPILNKEVVPGDYFNIDSEIFVRLMPLIAPIMHRMNCYVHYFFVPNRILWTGWEDFITGKQSTTMPIVTLSASHTAHSSLLDYLGLPLLPTTMPINQLPIRAYWAIWNEYYRDQNLQDEIDYTDWVTGMHNIAYRAWEKDYFTSSLPTPQQGASVNLPIGDVDYLDGSTWEALGGTKSGDIKADTTSSNDLYIDSPGFVGDEEITIKNIDTVNVDINDLRTAHRVQRWLEKNMRAGSRYVEHILAHFGVISSDKRLNRPEYIGGGKTPIVISEVLNTSDTTNAVQGEMSGHGIAVGKSNKCSYFVEEHGYIMGILSILPTTGYYQGMDKMWTRSVATDFYFPEFARLGEQEVLNKEIYVQGDSDDDEVFGYQARYAEYKYSQNRIHGDFKDSLLFWSLARSFAVPPALNENFVTTEIEGLALQTRVFAAGGVRDSFIVQIYHNIIAKRPMPYYADPTL